MARLCNSFAALASLICAAALAACGVANSDHIDFVASVDDRAPQCASTLGFYALPKDFLRVRLTQSGSAPPELADLTEGGKIGSTNVGLMKHPDSKLTFCLDHLNNPLSKDVVHVTKRRIKPADKSNEADPTPYLQSLAYNVTDESSVVIQALARAAFIGVSGDSGFGRGTADTEAKDVLVADLEFDPFDPEDLKRANRTLTRHGKCVFIETVTVRSGDAQLFCNAPERYAPPQVAQDYAALPRLDPHGPGVYYRPKMSFRVNVYARLPHSGAAWRMEQSATAAFDNLSPVLSLDLTRVAFANKVARFTFQDGALETACVSKGSEALGLADIPLAITRSLVDLPASIVKVRIAQAQNSKALVEAQNRVLALQNAILQAQSGQPYARPSDLPQPSGTPTSQAFSNSDKYQKINLSVDGADLQGFFPPNPAGEFTDKTACPTP